MQEVTPLRLRDYTLAMLPVWLVLNVWHAVGTVNMSRHAEGAARALVVGLKVMFPVFVAGQLPGIDPLVPGVVLACVYLGLLRWRAGRWSLSVVLVGSLVWLVLATLGRLAQYSAYLMTVSSKGLSTPFLFGFDDILMEILGWQMKPLVSAVIIVGIGSWAWGRLRRPGDARRMAKGEETV